MSETNVNINENFMKHPFRNRQKVNLRINHNACLMFCVHYPSHDGMQANISPDNSFIVKKSVLS